MTAIFIGAVAFIVLVLILKGVRIVPQAQNHIVERFGKYAATLKPGLNLINPLFSRIADRIDIREQVLGLPKQSIITKDNATVLVDAVVFYKIMDPYKAAYGIEDLQNAIINLAITTLRSLMGKLTLDESFSSRDTINLELLKALDEATDSWGTKITRVEMKDVNPQEDLAIAMALQKKAEQEKRATILNAEAKKQAAMTEAEGLKQAQILQAEGRKEAAFRDAEARERLAQAESNAIKYVAETLAPSEGSPLTYLLGQEYIKSLTKLGDSPNSKFLVMPADILETIGNVFKDKLGK
jgi:regulator of protease activity HflC (stomatin/prohibitin superfamily)